MKSFFVILLSLFVFSTTTAASTTTIASIKASTTAAAPATKLQCRNLFEVQNVKSQISIDTPKHDEDIVQLIFDYIASMKSTTSLRQESKYVIDQIFLNLILKKLQSEFGKDFEERDKPAAGKVFETDTDYVHVANYYYQGKKLAIKLRFRKYYEQNAEFGHTLDGAQVIDSLKTKSWIELKIDHPFSKNEDGTYDSVVIKPRLLVSDALIPYYQSTAFLKYIPELQQQLLIDNPEKNNDIQRFLTFLDILYSNKRMNPDLFARTTYQRSAYSIVIPSVDKNKYPALDVQITVDQNVRLFSYKKNKLIKNVYQPNEVVVEVKIPVKYARLTEADLAIYPGLKQISELKNQLTKNHHSDRHQIGSGKMGKLNSEDDESLAE